MALKEENDLFRPVGSKFVELFENPPEEVSELLTSQVEKYRAFSKNEKDFPNPTGIYLDLHRFLAGLTPDIPSSDVEEAARAMLDDGNPELLKHLRQRARFRTGCTELLRMAHQAFRDAHNS